MSKNIFSRGDSKPNSLETRILDEVQRKLPQAASNLLREQIGEINLVQRPNERETTFYNFKSGEAKRTKSPFPNRTEQLKFATVEFRTSNSEVHSADLYLVKGYFFSIVFDFDPNRFRDKGQEIEIRSVQILSDPMVPVNDEPVHVNVALPFEGWLREWENSYHIEAKKPSLESTEMERLLRNISVALPADYLEVVQQSDGFTIENCEIFGLSQTYNIVMPDGDYYVLAECQGQGVLGMKAKINDQDVYFLDYGGTDPERLGESFKAAVEELIRRNSKYEK